MPDQKTASGPTPLKNKTTTNKAEREMVLPTLHPPPTPERWRTADRWS